MIDASNAYIIVPSDFLEKAISVLEEKYRKFKKMPHSLELPCDAYFENGYSILEFEDILYGNLINESVLLIAKGIPHTVYWNRGNNYPAGTAHYRHNSEGKVVYCTTLASS